MRRFKYYRSPAFEASHVLLFYYSSRYLSPVSLMSNSFAFSL